MIIKMVLDSVDVLILLMSLACNQDDVTFAGHDDGGLLGFDDADGFII